MIHIGKRSGMKLLVRLAGVIIVVAVVAACGGSGDRPAATSTPPPPTATPAPTGMRIGSWQLLREIEGGVYSSVAIQTESVRGDPALLRISCFPQSGTAAAVGFEQPFNTVAGDHEVRVSSGSSFETQVWNLTGDRHLFTPSDLFDHAGLLYDLEGAHEFQFVADLEIDPERWTSFDVTGFKEAERQISPCDYKKGTLPTGAGNSPTVNATTAPTATPTTIPDAALTPTSTPAPTVAPVPTATPAPDGSLPNNWALARDEAADGQSYVTVSKWSTDGNKGARLAIQCQGSDDFYVSVIYIEPFLSVVSGQQDTRVSIDGSTSVERWLLLSNGKTLVSLDSEESAESLRGAGQFRIEIVVGLERRWSVFDLSGIQQALAQVHPCTDGRIEGPQVDADAGSSSNMPVLLGEKGLLMNGPQDHWEIAVLNVIEDARHMVDYTFSDAVKNSPPEQSRLYMVSLRVAYLGEENQYVNVSGRISAVGNKGGSYSPVFDRCGIIPDPFPRYADLSQGDIIEGNICWEIDEEDAPDLMMRFDPDAVDLLLGTAKPVWFSLAP